MPTAAASTGTRNFAPFAFSTSSTAMIAAPMAAPTPIVGHGNEPPNSPRATDAINVACGAISGSGCASVGTPMP